jgi:hypothetical protein
LILAYVGAAIVAICKRRTIGGSIGMAAAFLCGGFVIIPIAGAVATFLCWMFVLCMAVVVIVALVGG